MRKHFPRTFVVAATAVFALGISALAMAAGAPGGRATGTSQTVDGFTLDLKLLPAEPFTSKAGASKSANAGAMVYGGGAKPIQKGGAMHPNHHLVVFIKKDGKPVKHAAVRMSYRKHGAAGKMIPLPVTRMWVAGAGQKTTHYGNNLWLSAGTYDVHVTVNGKASADFEVTAK